MARSFSQEARSDSQKIGETRYRMSHLPSTTAIARTLLLAGILLAVTVLAARSFFPAFAQAVPDDPIDFEENSQDSVAVYTAIDPEGEDVEWTLAGTDEEDFSVDGGVLTFKDGPPDFETPKGGTGDNLNTYNVTVVAEAGTRDAATMTRQPVVVTVMNVEEDGEIEFSLLQPKEDRLIAATLKDPDGPPAAAANIQTDRTNLTDVTVDGQPLVSWQWATSSSATGPWNDIDGATTKEYTPKEEDIGDYLQVRVVYSDGHATDDPYTEDVDEAQDDDDADFGSLVVLAKDYTNTPPNFKDENADTPNAKDATREIDENSAAETEVGDPVAAVDLDDRKMQELLTYALTGPGSNLFTIDGRVGDTRRDSEPGQIRVADGATLNTESTAQYVLTVTATDPSGEEDDIEVTIAVVNVDEPPTFRAASLAQTVIPFEEITDANRSARNLNVGTNYSASDPEGVNITWYLDDISVSGVRNQDNEDNDQFEIDGTSGQLTFKEEPNYEPAGNRDKNHTYRVTVKVRDATENSASLPVQVLLGNLDEDGEVELVLQDRRAVPPVQPVPGITIRAELDDEDGIRTSVRRTSYQWYRSTTRPADTASWDKITTRGTGQTYTPVRDDPNDGNDVHDEGNYLRVVITYADTTSEDSNDIRMAIGETAATVTANSPNVPPRFVDNLNATTMAETVRDVPEDTAVGDAITSATDYAGRDDLTLYYTIKSGDTDIFGIDSSTGYLSLKEMLDFEDKASHSVTVTANDASLKTADIALTITVDDRPESPVIEEGDAGPNVEVTHAEGDTSVVMTLNASDDDDGNVDPEIPLTWSLSGTDPGSFDQSNLKGDSLDLQFNAAPDFEAKSSYSVTVTVTDSDSSTDELTVVITIDNVEEDGVVTLDTVVPKQDVAVIATLDDPDGGILILDAEWEWSRSGSKNGPWTPSTGENATSTGGTLLTGVTPTGSKLTGTYTPDKDDVGDYIRALVKYTDAEGEDKSMSVVSENTVREEDYVNRRPRFEIPEGTIPATTSLSIYENLEPGSAVGETLATDTDEAGDDEVLEYSLSGTDVSSFSLDRHTGVLTVASSADMDYEDPDDEDGTDDSTNATSPTDASPHTETATADDNRYNVVVTAEDPSGISTAIVVIITVKDIQEAPEIHGATATDDPETSVERPERSVTHTDTTQDPPFMPMIATYSAIDDEDDGDGVDTTYVKWILSGSDAEQFNICDAPVSNNECNAPGMATDDVELRFKGEPDFEMPSDSNRDNVYNVTIIATDSYGSSSSHDVTVTVTNVEETGAVKFTNRQPEVSIRLRAELTDPDGGIRDLTWQWSTGGPNAAVNTEADWTDILGATAAIYAPGSSDDGQKLRAIATYRDAANVDDPFTHNKDESIRTATKTPEFMVQVADNNNQAPVFPDQDDQTTGDQSERTTRSIPEDIDAGEIVGLPVTASTDLDGDDQRTEGDILTYTLGGTDAALFTIEQQDRINNQPETVGGQLRVGMGTKFDYETKTSYTVTVTATDPSLASDTIAVTINILDIDEPPEVSKRGLAVSGNRSVSYAENDTGDVATYRATGSDSAGATWSLEGADAGAFAVSSGMLAFRSSPNYESPTDQNTDNSYEVTVKATSGSLMASRNVTVNVTNVDETGSVSISSPNNEVKVGVQLTAELDEGDEETVVGWQWASSADGSTGWSDITGETSNTYTPVAGDVGNYLRVTVTYNDPLGSGKTLSEVTASAVVAEAVGGTPGTVSLSPSSGLVSSDSVTATLADDDALVGAVSWQWARSEDGNAPWTDIATSASYTTVDTDAGNFLRATATYEDASGPGQTAEAETGTRVAIHRYDGNADGLIQRPEVINAINDFLFGSGTSRAEVIVVINLYLFG